MERNWSDSSIFSRVQNGKSISEIGHFRHQTVLGTEGYFVRKQSPSPKTTEVIELFPLLSVEANLCLTVVGNRQDNT